MPLYEYECRQCGVRFERRQSVHEDPASECPDCGGAVRRVLFPVGIIFKGSGFYITDSRRPQPIGNGGNGSKPKEAASAEASQAKPVSDGKAGSESKEATGATS